MVMAIFVYFKKWRDPCSFINLAKL